MNKILIKDHRIGTTTYSFRGQLPLNTWRPSVRATPSSHVETLLSNTHAASVGRPYGPRLGGVPTGVRTHPIASGANTAWLSRLPRSLRSHAGCDGTRRRSSLARTAHSWGQEGDSGLCVQSQGAATLPEGAAQPVVPGQGGLRRPYGRTGDRESRAPGPRPPPSLGPDTLAAVAAFRGTAIPLFHYHRIKQRRHPLRDGEGEERK